MRECVRAIAVRDGKLLVMRRNKYGDRYLTLPGGGIQPGETKEEALRRELAEESGLSLVVSRLVFIDRGLPDFGAQYIFLCELGPGEPRLAECSEEFRDSASGNEYQPAWVDVAELGGVSPFRPDYLAAAIRKSLASGFPQEPAILERRLVEETTTAVAEGGSI